MEAVGDKCWFDYISDDVLLHILCFVPRKFWVDLTKVCSRFKMVCHDKDIFRYTDLQNCVGLTENRLKEYLGAGRDLIEVLNLNHCYWFTSTCLLNSLLKCQKVQHLFLLDCKLTINALAKVVCSLECLKTLVISVASLLEFSSEINLNQTFQQSLKHIEHFGIHTREDITTTAPRCQQVSSQKTIFEYCPNMETFCMIVSPGMNHKENRHFIHPLIKTEKLRNLKNLSINSTAYATTRLYYFAILTKSLAQAGKQFMSLSLSVLDKGVPILCHNLESKTFNNLINTLKESCMTLQSLDMSGVDLVNLDAFFDMDKPALQYLNLSHTLSTMTYIMLLRVSRCSNLVSLNLQGASGTKTHWGQHNLQALGNVLEQCKNLRHLNLSDLHLHLENFHTSPVSALTKYNITGLRSLALPSCSLAETSSNADYVNRVSGKRQRIDRHASLSVALAAEMSVCRLQSACPHLESLEIINPGQRVALDNGPFTLPHPLCPLSCWVGDAQLSQVSRWIHLRYLQITGAPGVTKNDFLKAIGESCQSLKILHLAYIGLGAAMSPAFWDCLQYFPALLDLRIEQTQMSVNERFLRSCQACQRLERLVLVSRTGSVDTQSVENFVHSACGLFLIVLLTDMTLKNSDLLQATLQRGYECSRPGFLALVAPLSHDKANQALQRLPLIHLVGITKLASTVATRPFDGDVRPQNK
ncbi:F-box/LRR-repeat protein 18-like isoform X1 [Dreissena polymorpha]|uniref:F-box/LRR-repeat protein 18-like isoform X1 n=1 Tax=Dreissena polymorpha TaxID=45954 RepID=UPI002264C5C2|nr:F-box/LRR-repeat protein 18-like isoform X1 [Dreissena polymorpha]